jgi:hypothetical protein
VARPQVYMDRYKQALEDCKLNDLGYSSDPFKWRNNSRKMKIIENIYTELWQIKSDVLTSHIIRWSTETLVTQTTCRSSYMWKGSLRSKDK